MAEVAVVAILKADAAVNALIDERVYPLELRQGTQFPAISYQRISTQRDSNMGVDTGVVIARVQVNSYAERYGEAKELNDAVRAALQRYRGTIAGVEILDSFIDNEFDYRSEAADMYGVLTDYQIHYREILS